jgi:soluble lytic murein transglycosylase-like protein
MTFFFGALGIFLITWAAYGKESKPSEQTRVSMINNAYDSLFKFYAQLYNLDWKMLKAIAYVESRIGLDKRVRRGIENPNDIENSKSFDGKSWGIMQTTITTSRDYDPSITEAKLNNPETSIKIAAQHIAFLKKRYPQFSERDIVMSYNHGQGNQLSYIQKEKAGTLGLNEFVAGRDYYKKYLKAKELIG